MEYVQLGGTGLRVSRLALGCMSYGDPTTPGAHEWSLNDDEAQSFFLQAVELGITFWDTANVYQHGTSDAIAALDLHLTTDEVRALEEPYTHHGPSWF